MELTVNATDVQFKDMLGCPDVCELQSPEHRPPDVKGLEFRMGPSTSNSTSWVNGVTTSEQRYTYNYKVVGSGEILHSCRFGRPAKTAESKPVRCLLQASTSTFGQNAGTTQRQPTRDLVTAIEPSKRTLYLRNRSC